MNVNDAHTQRKQTERNIDITQSVDTLSLRTRAHLIRSNYVQDAVCQEDIRGVSGIRKASPRVLHGSDVRMLCARADAAGNVVDKALTCLRFRAAAARSRIGI
jgi:hypothetical protein